jgi:hypothetical protein
MNMSWFMWVWALMAVLVVSGMLAVVVTGLTVLRLVRRNWTRLVSEAASTFDAPDAPTPDPAPWRSGPRSRPPRSPRPEPRDARA